MAQFDHRALGGAGKWMSGGINDGRHISITASKANGRRLVFRAVTNLAMPPSCPFPSGFQAQHRGRVRPQEGGPDVFRYRFGQPFVPEHPASGV